MALRSSWEGFLRLSLISVPVKAYSAAVIGRGKIAFHQLHAKCHRRIRHQKVCPIHGEVPNDEIVSGYEYAKDEYVVIDPKELAKLRPGSDKTINIEVFVQPDALDPIYFTERSYYLAPDGKAGHKPYAILHKVMADEKRFALATMVFAGRDHQVLIRPLDRLLAVTVLSYAAQVKTPSSFDDEIPRATVSSQELKLARTLVDESTADHFDFSTYEDEYTGKVTKLIEAKASGKKLVTARKNEEPHVINLMDALRRSLKAVKRSGPAMAPARNGKFKRGRRVVGKKQRVAHKRAAG
ncbi:MAG TPA: Ku protein [Gemmataceae bacterium]|nr:Ku protein [Gemmataceae bacterium]